MPHDKNGVQLRDGDIVTIHCRIKHVIPNTSDEYNNLTVETIEEFYPTNSYTVVILNAKQVQKVASAPEEK